MLVVGSVAFVVIDRFANSSPGSAASLVDAEPAVVNPAVAVADLGVADSPLVIRGDVLAHKDSAGPWIRKLEFAVANGATDGQVVDLTSEGVSVLYRDFEQLNGIPFAGTPDGAFGWRVRWLTGAGPVLDPGEVAFITIDLSDLGTPVGANRAFSLQIKSRVGPELRIDSAAPEQLSEVFRLEVQ